MEDIRKSLLDRAFLYADQEAYRAGVEAALAALAKAMHPASGSPMDEGRATVELLVKP